MRDGWKWLAFNALFVLVYVPGVVQGVLTADHEVWWKVVATTMLVLYAAGWVAMPAVLWRGSDDNRRTVACLVLLAFSLVMVFLLGLDSAGLMVYAMATTAMALPARRAVLIDGVLLVGLSVAMYLTGALERDGGQLVTLMSVSLGMVSLGRLFRANRELRRAQEEIATMAATEERNRLARDLHDILGHSLTTITVKTGLARRLLENDERDRAYDEVKDIENLSRQVLGDVRATVSGYREVSLSAEVVGARAALRAAGVTADLPHAVDNVHPDLQQVFGYVLREGVTNVLRHSSATRCEVRLGAGWLEVRDDGRGVGTGRSGNGRSGTGLAGLAERLAEVGGTVEAGPLAGGGYRLRAEVA